MSDFQQKVSTDDVSSLREELSSTLVECASLKADLDEMTAVVQRKEDDVGRLLSNVFMEVSETYKDMVMAVKLRI